MIDTLELTAIRAGHEVLRAHPFKVIA